MSLELTTEVSGPAADWGGLERHRGWRLESWGVERKELSGENNRSYSHNHLDSPRILDRSGGLERTHHVLRCIDLLGHT
jgi:hypothetical protein